jgi:hypothetical protein
MVVGRPVHVQAELLGRGDADAGRGVGDRDVLAHRMQIARQGFGLAHHRQLFVRRFLRMNGRDRDERTMQGRADPMIHIVCPLNAGRMLTQGRDCRPAKGGETGRG